MKKSKIYRKLLEAADARPQMIKEIETMFGLGEHTWDEGPNFSPNRIHLIGMFDIINKYIFEGKLDRTEKKRIIDSRVDPHYKNAEAAFLHGLVKGQPHELIVVIHAEKSNFFNVFCAMIHEMIHFYDFNFGPMGQMLKKNLITGHLNWGDGYHKDIDSSLSSTQIPDCLSPIPMKLRLDRKQLPDDMPNFNCAKQYMFPWFEDPKFADFYLRNGIYDRRALKSKYVLSEEQMYDVHGKFFKNFAARANYAGFEVAETFDPTAVHKFKKTWESDASGEINIAEFISSNIKTKDHIGIEYRDNDNWAVEIF